MNHGLSGISHANLDYVGLIESYDDFRPLFLDAVSKVNPGMIDLGRAPVARGPRDLNILAHVSQRGDVVFLEGEVIEDEGGRGQIEGMSVMPPMHEALGLEYMGHSAHSGDLDWVPAGTFLGERGKWRALEGVAFRLTGERARMREIHYQVRIGAFEWSAPSKDGQFCGTRGQKKPLTGMRVWLVETGSLC